MVPHIGMLSPENACPPLAPSKQNMKKHYIIVDDEDKEVNFYDEEFPNAKNRAIDCAKQVNGGIVVARYSGEGSDQHGEEVIWTPFDEK